jgi:anion-transporting  ArsA/GET3 family ATPase
MNMAEGITDKNLFLVTGKGGVGKSTIAAALAYQLAQKNFNTKLVELDLDSYFSKLFEKEVTSAGVEIAENLKWARWTGMDCLSEYVDHLVKLKGLGKLFFDNPVMSKLLNIAPGLFELAILGKLTAGPRNHGPKDESDKIVLDSYATGHSLSMLMAPKVMADSVKVGPMHDQSKGIVDVIESSQFQILIVSTPELMAVEESLELSQKLSQNFQLKPIFVINRCYQSFEELPRMESQWDQYLFAKNAELERVEKLLVSEGHTYFKSDFVLEANDSFDLLNKVSSTWNL